MIKDGFLSFMKDFYFKIYFVKIKHNINKIIIPDGSINGVTVFHQKDGFPIKILLESFLVMIIKCRHKVTHEFKIPIISSIEWKIVNGIADGAFKHGFGINTKYTDNDSGASVIYYPPIEGFGKKDCQIKEIPILIRIKSIYDKQFNKNNVVSIKSDPIDSISLNDFDNYQFLLTLFLNQKKGILKRMYYEISLTVKKIDIENQLNNFSKSQYCKSEGHDSNSFDIGSIKEEDKDNYSVFLNLIDNCSSCNVDLTLKLERDKLSSSSLPYAPKIDIEINRLFTSEFIKISHSTSYNSDTHRNNTYPLICTIKNKDKDIYKFQIMNCPPIHVYQNIWHCTAGSFPCDNKGDCVIYYTPQEKELCKSPIILSLYKKGIFDNNDEKQLNLVDQKKIWLLRRNVMGG